MDDAAELLSKLHKSTRIPPIDLVGKLQKRYTDRGGVERVLELDYLGHAAVTDILLDVDPLWSWEPAALDEAGRPLVDRDKDGWPRGLWIRLTILGHTRLGYGTCAPGKPDAIKELIGDALRNAAMRFGIALSLWAKEEWADEGVEGKEVSAATGGSRDGAGPSDGQRPPEDNGPAPGNVGPVLPQDQAIAAKAATLGLTDDERAEVIERATNGRTRSGKDVKPREVALIFTALEATAAAKR